MTRRTSALLITVVAALGIAAANPAALIDQLLAEQRAHVHKPAYAASAEIPTEITVDQPCADGLAAGEFACDGIDLVAFWPSADFGGVLTNDPSGQVFAGNSDVWGWTDPETGEEIAIVGHTNGTAFIRVNDGVDAEYLGSVPNTAAQHAVWHDIKIINDHALIVSESAPNHGMQVFDLTSLRGAAAVPAGTPLVPDAVFTGSGSQHNVVANDDSDYAYIVGGGLKARTPIGSLGVQQECDGGLFMVDMADPVNPVDMGCYEGDEYIHDAQCVIYPEVDAPDSARFGGHEICATFSEDYMSLVDVTDKANPHPIGRLFYPDTQYTHQGWFTEDFRYVLMNDELDEANAEAVSHTRTLVIDATDLTRPVLHHVALRDGSDGNPATKAIDHNNYTHGGLAYQSNYTSGLRVIDLAGLDSQDGPQWHEVAYFDTYPADDGNESATFAGTWSNYPYFSSGIIPVTGMGEGVFFLRLQDGVGSP